VNSLHLNADQLAAWLAGDRSAEAAAHLHSCAACQSQVASFESAVSNFRSGLTTIAESPHPATLQTSKTSRSPSWFRPVFSPGYGWAVAAVLVAVLAVVPFYKTGGNSPQPPRTPPIAIAEVSDTALFEQMDAQLARSVPRSMEPLAALSWTGSDSEASSTNTNGNE
jgi:hypothetical protein